MTRADAQETARRRWGAAAGIRHRLGSSWPDPFEYAVGRRDGLSFEALGEGATWEEAFADADRRRH